MSSHLPRPTLFFKMTESTTSADFSPSSMRSLLERFKLKEEDLQKKITEKHIDVISRTCCREWKSLRSHMEMEELVEHDIEKGPGTEQSKR